MNGAVLRMRNVTYVRKGETIVSDTSLDVFADTQVAVERSNPRAAKMLALLAAGIARPTQGSVLIGEYDPRVQPVHCKRIAAYVPHDPMQVAPTTFARFIDYRAALWNIDVDRAHAHAARIMERLSGLHEAFAYPIVAALIASPELLVLDRPQPAYACGILAAAGRTALFSTHVDRDAARAFTLFVDEREA